MEVVNSGSQADGLQQRVTGRKKSRRGSEATHKSVTVEEQKLSQAEALNGALNYTNRRSDIGTKQL